jgi:uncharacterized protein (TIGR03435 family)
MQRSNRQKLTKCAETSSLAVAIIVGIVGTLLGQSQQDIPQWELAAGGGKMSFEVASVKLGSFVPPSFPLDAGDSFKQTGGRFVANFPLLQLVMFAYKINPAPEQRQKMLQGVPSWFSQDRYTIEAQAQGNPTKDQFRLMMQSLLSERFHLKVHRETQQVSAFALELASAGKLGPGLHPHGEDPPCDSKTAGGAADLMPCGNVGARRDAKGGMITGARNVTMPLLADVLSSISNGEVNRPVIDRTGLNGGFDITMPGVGPALPGAQLDPQAPSFMTVLREQLGLKLTPTSAAVQVLVIDTVERPSEN